MDPHSKSTKLKVMGTASAEVWPTVVLDGNWAILNSDGIYAATFVKTRTYTEIDGPEYLDAS